MPPAHESRVVVTVNGPGETSGWLVPLGRRLREVAPSTRIDVALTPCVFATGAEAAVVRALPFVGSVLTPASTLALAAGRMPPASFAPDLPGVLIHLGGDQVLASTVARRLGIPAIAYVEKPTPWSFLFEDVLYSGFDPRTRAGPRAARMIGDMIVDSVRHRRTERGGPPKIVLCPGSRDYIAKFLLPFFAKVAETLAAHEPDAVFAVARSPFIGPDFFEAVPDVNDGRPLEGDNLRSCRTGETVTLLTKGGLSIAVEDMDAALTGASLALTIPGTVTAQLAAAGTPHVLVLPTYWAETAPLPGLAGHLRHLPLVGRHAKRLAGLLYLSRHRFLAHANVRTRSRLVPELVGRVTSRQVAEEALALLRADPVALGATIRASMGPDGAAARLVDRILPYLGAVEDRASEDHDGIAAAG